MLWTLLALASYTFSGLSVIGNKFIIKNKVQNQFVLQIWLGLLGSTTLIYTLFTNTIIPSANDLLLLGLAEVTTFLSAMLILRALKIDEVSRVAIALNLTPVFSFALAWIFIDEKLPLSGIIALILLTTGSILASIHIKKDTNPHRLSRSLPIIALSCLLMAISGVTWDSMTGKFDPLSMFAWSYLFTVIFDIILLAHKPIRHEFIKSLHTFNKKTFFGMFTTTTLSNFGFIFFMWALQQGPVSLIYASSGFQTLFVFAVAILISKFTKTRLEDELDRKNLLLKSLSLVIMITGIVMINL